MTTVPRMSPEAYRADHTHLHLATQPVDEPDLLALLADEQTPLGKPLADAFRNACKAEADICGSFAGESPAGPRGYVNPSRVRLALLDDPHYEARQYAALWSVACARGGYLEKTGEPVAITGKGSRGNTNKSTVWRRWVA